MGDDTRLAKGTHPPTPAETHVHVSMTCSPLPHDLPTHLAPCAEAFDTQRESTTEDKGGGDGDGIGEA